LIRAQGLHVLHSAHTNPGESLTVIGNVGYGDLIVLHVYIYTGPEANLENKKLLRKKLRWSTFFVEAVILHHRYCCCVKTTVFILYAPSSFFSEKSLKPRAKKNPQQHQGS